MCARLLRKSREAGQRLRYANFRNALGTELSAKIDALIVFGLIVAYHVLVVLVTMQLCLIAIQSAKTWSGGLQAVFQAGGLVIVCGLITQLAWHVITTVRTLIIAKHDLVSADADGLKLSRLEFPELHQLIAKVAKSTATEAPNELRITPYPQCFVVEKRHLGLRDRHRHVLAIGLPHLEVLSIAELKVIVAHELAHFRYRDTVLRVFLFRFLESLRLTVESMQRRWWRWVHPLYSFCRVYRWLSIFLTAPVHRRQELRSDRVSAAIYGRRLTMKTLISEWLVATRFNLAFGQSIDAFCPEKDGNIFRAFANRWRDLSPAGRAYLQHRLAEEEHASFCNSHPTMKERLAAISGFPDRGMTNSEPARDLINNLDLDDLEQQLHRRLMDELAENREGVPTLEGTSAS